MKLAIIGGAGLRVPLIVNGLFRAGTDLKASELALYDIDHERRETIARIAEAMAKRVGGTVRVSRPDSLAEALEGASFVLSSIRVGGLQGRRRDERIAVEHGLPGQETVGPGGFALALRTIPVLVEYARQVAALAPDAWMINFTNPVGIMAEALLREGLGARCIGVCDTPREQFLHLAEALRVPLRAASCDYFGLNHLGWIRAVRVGGRDRMQDLLASDEALEAAYPAPFFSKQFLRELGLLPTEYLFFYYSPREAYRKTKASGSTRADQIRDFDDRLMRSAAEAGGNEAELLDAYDLYLARRNASYMTLETGEPVGERAVSEAREMLYQSAVGYERIALDVMGALSGKRVRVMPVDVANQGAIPDLETETAVEVPCAIDANGARPLAAGRLPAQVRQLVLQVKEFEKATVAAAFRGSRSLAVEALAGHPLVERRDLAESLVDAYQRVHAPQLNYLK